jgi:ribosomal protein S12 methylthiotransferase accessory factor
MQTDTPSLSWIASREDQSVLRLPGTDRARPPSTTLAMARRAAAKTGVTRVADITRLDTIGIATYQAVRPAARTLAVSQGKGLTPELAMLSAMMEAIELWHAEQPMAPVVRAAPRDLDRPLGYPVEALAPAEPSVLHEGLPLDWVEARSLVDGSETLVPIDVVRLSLEQKTGWNPPAFFESTNGLASGNTLVEATLHALYEVIERDAMTAVVTAGGDLGVCVDPRTLRSRFVDELCRMIAQAGVSLQVRFVPSPTNLPCFLAWVSCADYPTEMFGFGCHLSAEIALTRAITEAAQTRLCYISGARDDLKSEGYDADVKRRRASDGRAADLGGWIPRTVEHQSLLDTLQYVVRQTAIAFSHAPVMVDLTRDDIGVPVVKVVAPGSRISPEVL